MLFEKYKFPEKYAPILNPLETQGAIKLIKDTFERALACRLNLLRVTAPLFVQSGTGVNDDLNGIERPIRFTVANMDHMQVEIVQSLAKWKRLMLAEFAIPKGSGIYTDMNAVRPDENPDALHSIYVDQWDWERTMDAEERDVSFLKAIVRSIYDVLLATEAELCRHFPLLQRQLPADIFFIHSEELQQLYPDCSPEERENRICREHGAVFVIGIGAPLNGGEPHDRRAPDYDDWSTPNGVGRGLNGDIFVWYPVLNCAMELSSMGIRVDAEALERQLSWSGTLERKQLYFHQRLLTGKLPHSVGGGIGQSRMCMLLLQKAHIGEVQAGIWPAEMKKELHRRNIPVI